MAAYILRRLLLIIPTLLGIMAINFAVIQFAPGGPVERVLSEVSQIGGSATDSFTNSADIQTGSSGGAGSKYRGARGLDPELIADLEKQFGFDKPPLERFGAMLWNYVRFDFGESYFRSISVIDLIKEKMPVSISLGLWTTLIAYLISIPLGIRKAVKDGSPFDTWTSALIIVGYAVPSFLFAILLRTVFAGGSFWKIFPLRGLHSEEYVGMPFWEAVLTGGWWADYLWHLVLPVSAMIIGAFATLTLLTKNSFLDEIKKQYVLTARAKGLTERSVLYRHVFRNAMLIVVAGFPSVFVSVFFTGSLLIEVIFSLDGLGLMGYTAVVDRDYAVVFATLFIFSLLGLMVKLISDLVYVWIDPRIDFEKREV